GHLSGAGRADRPGPQGQDRTAPGGGGPLPLPGQPLGLPVRLLHPERGPLRGRGGQRDAGRGGSEDGPPAVRAAEPRRRSLVSGPRARGGLAMPFRAVTYNSLANAYLKPEWYAAVPPELLRPERRLPALLCRVEALDADLLCLQ